jgi:hypothetical protein
MFDYLLSLHSDIAIPMVLASWHWLVGFSNVCVEHYFNLLFVTTNHSLCVPPSSVLPTTTCCATVYHCPLYSHVSFQVRQKPGLKLPNLDETLLLLKSFEKSSTDLNNRFWPSSARKSHLAKMWKGKITVVLLLRTRGLTSHWMLLTGCVFYQNPVGIQKLNPTRNE